MPQSDSQRTKYNRWQENFELWDCPRELQKTEEYTKTGTNKTLACVFEDMREDLSYQIWITRFP